MKREKQRVTESNRKRNRKKSKKKKTKKRKTKDEKEANNERGTKKQHEEKWNMKSTRWQKFDGCTHLIGRHEVVARLHHVGQDVCHLPLLGRDVALQVAVERQE